MRRVLLLLTGLVFLLFPSAVKADTGITDVYLVGPGGTGGTASVPNVNGGSATIGTSAAGTILWEAQSFSVPSGVASQFTAVFNATTGAPTGTVTYNIKSQNVSIPGALIETGTFTPTASATNTITLASTNFLQANTTYWLELKSTNTQTANNFWTLRINASDQYAAGNRAQSSGTGASWGVVVAQDDVLSLTTAAGSAPADTLNDKLAQSFSVSQTTVVSAVSLNLKKVGSPTGTLTLALESDAGQMPSGVEAITGATVTLAESSLTTSYAETAFTLSSTVTLRPGVFYWWNLTTDRTDSTVYVVWGATGVCTGQWFRNHVNGAWQLEQNIATYQLTIDSVSAPTSQDLVTLSSGVVGTVDYSITGGEAGLFGLGIIFLIVMIFGIFQLRKP